jgi:hypothetical protein
MTPYGAMFGVRGELLREASMTSRRFPPPWQVEQTPGGFNVLDANGQALVYVYARREER